MFTGIVEEPGRVRSVTDGDEGRRLGIEGDEVLDGIHHGQSISVSGVCLTVEAFDEEGFEVFLSQETLEKSYLDGVAAGDTVNLERAMSADGRFDGHVVQGHVDTTTDVLNVTQLGDDWEYEFAIPEGYGRYIVEKGSVTLDGISLTVADLREGSFTVAVIPATRELTNLSEKKAGDRVHLEVDVIAKYVEQMLDGHSSAYSASNDAARRS